MDFIFQLRSRPKSPRRRNAQLEAAHNPQGTLHPARAHREKTTNDSTDQHSHKPTNSPVSHVIVPPSH